VRPHNLKLAGFTCYSDPVEIDFSNLDLFVICGPTGAGKSTIIVAICYALYGRVPRETKSTLALISHNRDDMRVALEFEAGGRRYRVSRGVNTTRRTAKGGAETVTRNPSPVVLEGFGDGGWEPLHDRVQSVDAEIERIIGLDFDAFTKCVLLPQGKFQEFLTGDAADRRGLLVELLGTGVYDRVGSAARARGSELKTQADGIDRRLTEDYADATPEALETARAELAGVIPRREAAQAHRTALQQAVGFATKVVDARKREKDRKAEHDKAVARADELRVMAQDGEQQEAALREQIAVAEREIKELAYDAALHQQLHLAHEKAKHGDDIARDLATTQAAASATDPVRDAEAAFSAAEAAEKQAAAALTAAQGHLDEVHREHAAESVRAGLKRGDACPVCGGAISTLPKTKAGNIDAAKKAVERAQGAENKSSAAVRTAELALVRERQQIEQARAQASKLAAALATARLELQGLLPAGVAADVAAIKSALSAQNEAATRTHALTSERDAARLRLDALLPQVADAAAQIAACDADAKRLLEECTAAGSEAATAKDQLIELSAAWPWDDVRNMIDAKRDPGARLQDMLRACQTESDQLAAREATLEQSAARIAQDIARAAELRTELEGKRAGAANYRDLGNLLRADAFQAFIIEEAMQALADTASAHLATLYSRFAMTVENSEFHVIDHWQADQKRAARTLSGGETFVASLALALALSERLPELRSQASAVLESLFLDEGFGTLDPEVLDVVISALEGLRSQERMVGIITHVPELARRIESRIEVTTSPAGSMAVAS
jgi:exonuclease SbcC